jgi:hypothetical protein
VAKRTHNVQRYTKMAAGGHFAQMEQPAILAADIREFFTGLLNEEWSGGGRCKRIGSAFRSFLGHGGLWIPWRHDRSVSCLYALSSGSTQGCLASAARAERRRVPEARHEKKFAYASFIPAKSSGCASNTVTS